MQFCSSIWHTNAIGGLSLNVSNTASELYLSSSEILKSYDVKRTERGLVRELLSIIWIADAK